MSRLALTTWGGDLKHSSDRQLGRFCHGLQMEATGTSKADSPGGISPIVR